MRRGNEGELSCLTLSLPFALRRFTSPYGRFTSLYGRFTSLYGRFTVALRRFTVALRRFTSLYGRFTSPYVALRSFTPLYAYGHFTLCRHAGHLLKIEPPFIIGHPVIMTTLWILPSFRDAFRISSSARPTSGGSLRIPFLFSTNLFSLIRFYSAKELLNASSTAPFIPFSPSHLLSPAKLALCFPPSFIS